MVIDNQLFMKTLFRRITVFLSISLLYSCFVFGQADSLLAEFEKSETPAAQIENLKHLNQVYLGANVDSALLVMRAAIEIAEDVDDPNQLLSCYYYFIRSCVYGQKWDEAIAVENKCLAIIDNENPGKKTTGDIYNAFGAINSLLAEDDKAISYYLKAETFIKEKDDKTSLAGLYNKNRLL